MYGNIKATKTYMYIHAMEQKNLLPPQLRQRDYEKWVKANFYVLKMGCSCVCVCVYECFAYQHACGLHTPCIYKREFISQPRTAPRRRRRSGTGLVLYVLPRYCLAASLNIIIARWCAVHVMHHHTHRHNDGEAADAEPTQTHRAERLRAHTTTTTTIKTDAHHTLEL